MNLSNIKELGLGPEALADVHVDHVAAITSDEFHRRTDDTRDYRVRAIDRIIRQGLSLHTNCNLVFDIARQFVQITCPYCKKAMVYKGGGGSSDTSTVEFKCESCQATAHLTMSNHNGLCFIPKGSED